MKPAPEGPPTKMRACTLTDQPARSQPLSGYCSVLISLVTAHWMLSVGALNMTYRHVHTRSSTHRCTTLYGTF